MMDRWLTVIGLALFVAGCTNGLAQRQAELALWVGRPETDLVGVMGAPSRSYETGGMKFLTYEDRRLELVPGSPYYWSGGFPPTALNLVCDTTFTVGGGVVRAFSLRGNACG